MIDLRPLIQPSFWFDMNPTEFSPFFEKGFFLVFALMIILGGVIRIVSRQKKYDRLTRVIFLRFGSALFVMGILGFVYFFFTFENVYLLGARFWFLAWLISLLAWLISIVHFIKVQAPKLREDALRKAEESKYLPRKNSR